MDISVIIPTYKPESYIYECLESLNQQTLKKDRFEIIIILNGCGEPWKSQIEGWIKLHDSLNVRFINTNKTGVSNARNIGLSESEGEYITFIDDDDYVSKTYLEDLFQETKGCSIVLSNSISFLDGTCTFDEDYANRKVYYGLKNSQNINLFSARTILNGPCMKLIKKSVIKNTQFDTSFKNGEDSLFMFEISKEIGKIKLANESAIYYRRFRPNSAVTSRKKNSYIIANSLRLSCAMIMRYIKSPFKYNLMFTVTRVLAPFKSAFIDIRNNIKQPK